MSGETEANVSAWNVDTLREHFNRLLTEMDLRYQQRFDAQQTQVRDALAAADRANTKAENATEKRFDATNEFRGQLNDQAATLMPRAEAQARFAAYDDKIAALEKARERQEGATRGINAAWGVFVAAIGVAAAITVVLAFAGR